MEPVIYFVYVDKKPQCGTVFYVGKGNKNRLNLARRNVKWQAIVDISGGFNREIVFSSADEKEALDKERELIKEYGRANLCNMTNGGQGVSGMAYTPERKAEISKRFKGVKKGVNFIKYLKGRVYSDETKAKIAASNSRRKFSPETIEKMRQSALGRKASEETRKNISASLIGNTYRKNKTYPKKGD